MRNFVTDVSEPKKGDSGPQSHPLLIDLCVVCFTKSNVFLRILADAVGSSIYCESCHNKSSMVRACRCLRSMVDSVRLDEATIALPDHDVIDFFPCEAVIRIPRPTVHISPTKPRAHRCKTRRCA